MKAILIALLSIAAIQANVIKQKNYITPLGPMDLDDLVFHYMQYRYHKYDYGAEYLGRSLKTWTDKLNEMMNQPNINENDMEFYKEIKEHFEDFHKDIKNETIIEKCSLDRVAGYYDTHFKRRTQEIDSENSEKLYKSFWEHLKDMPTQETKDQNDIVVEFIRKDQSLYEKVLQNALFEPICCKYWNKGYHDEVIKGEC